MQHLDVFDMQRKWDTAFPSQNKGRLKLVSLVWHHHLDENGDIKRVASIRLRCAKGVGRCRYVWRIPHEREHRRPIALEVRTSQGVLPFTNSTFHEDNRSVTEVTIDLGPRNTGEEINFEVAYSQRACAALRWRGLFSREWRYDWVYKVCTDTESFELRVHLPRGATVKPRLLRSSLPGEYEVCRIDGRSVFVATASHPTPGFKGGQITYTFRTQALPPTISLVAGLLLGVPLRMLTDASWPVAGLLSLVVAAGVYAQHWLRERWETE
jgi:hypothetical protein